MFKTAFARLDIAQSELEAILPAEIRAQVDLASLEVCPGSFVDDDLRHSHSDLLYSVRTKRGGDALVYVLFEHQSSFDARMPLRLLRYIVRIWERWLGDHPLAKRMPIVVPVVLHHGATEWQAAPGLSSMLDASPELLEATRPFLPLFRFLLDDLSALSLDALSARALSALTRLVELAFWSSRSLARLRDAAPLMREVTGALVRDARTRALLEQLYVYLQLAAQPDVDVEEVRTILLEVAGPQGREDVMNAGEQLIEQGRTEGLTRGQAEGLRTAITMMLASRTPPLSDLGRERLAACSDVPVLTRWLARAVAGVAEGEVFAEP
jgi:predicted transposase YdaD